MEPPSLSARFVMNVEAFRLLTKEYYLLSETDQKEVRHQLYSKHGAFGKKIVALLPEFHKMEQEFQIKQGAKQL
jgi:hypothetical protein